MSETLRRLWVLHPTFGDIVTHWFHLQNFPKLDQVNSANLLCDCLFCSNVAPHWLLLLIVPWEGSNMVKYGCSSHTSLVSVPTDYHLQEAGPFRWSFARGQSLWMIICNGPIPWDDQLREASAFEWSFARGGPFGLSFARGLSLEIIICKRPVPSDNHLQEADPFRWSFARGRSLRMIVFISRCCCCSD